MNKCLFRRGSQIRKFLSYRHIPGLVIEQGKHKKHIGNILSSKFWESKAIFKIPIPNIVLLQPNRTNKKLSPRMDQDYIVGYIMWSNLIANGEYKS